MLTLLTTKSLNFLEAARPSSLTIGHFSLQSMYGWTWPLGLAIALFCLIVILFRHILAQSDGNGNRVPHGPLGLPIVGQ